MNSGPLPKECVRRAYSEACRLDVATRKPGNVSLGAPGHRMDASMFLRSAEVTAPILCDDSRSLGATILASVEATWEAVGDNTNLGIILLCAPLAQVGLACDTRDGFGNQIHQLIRRCTVTDAQQVFDAIVRMSPAGLGDSDQHDVNLQAQSSLLEVMQAGADRDRIAWQYANQFGDVTGFGNRSFLRAIEQEMPPENRRRSISTAVVLALYLDFLSEFPDSHIARKHGAYMAEVVRDEARSKKEEYRSLTSAGEREDFIDAYDKALKDRGINPGTSADLTVAAIFYQLLQLNGVGELSQVDLT